MSAATEHSMASTWESAIIIIDLPKHDKNIHWWWGHESFGFSATPLARAGACGWHEHVTIQFVYNYISAVKICRIKVFGGCRANYNDPAEWFTRLSFLVQFWGEIVICMCECAAALASHVYVCTVQNNRSVYRTTLNFASASSGFWLSKHFCQICD